MIYEYNLIRKKVSDDVQKPILTPKQLVNYAKKYCFSSDEMWREKCFAVMFDNGNTPTGHFLVSVGTDNSCLISPRYIIEAMLLANCSKVAIIHNHTGANVKPSKNDIEQTQKLSNSLKTMDMMLIDHVIINESSFFSFDSEIMINPSN